MFCSRSSRTATTLLSGKAAGTWTAAIWTLKTLARYTGEVRFDYFTQRFESGGTVTPATQTLAPGETASFTVSLNSSPEAGDRTASVRLSTGGDSDGALPIVVRSLVPTNDSGGSFASADAAALAAADPSHTYREGATASTGLDDVSIATGPTSWAAAVQARPGACFYLHLTDAGGIFYGVGTVCTGSVAMHATDPRW